MLQLLEITSATGGTWAKNESDMHDTAAQHADWMKILIAHKFGEMLQAAITEKIRTYIEKMLFEVSWQEYWWSHFPFHQEYTETAAALLAV